MTTLNWVTYWAVVAEAVLIVWLITRMRIMELILESRPQPPPSQRDVDMSPIPAELLTPDIPADPQPNRGHHPDCSKYHNPGNALDHRCDFDLCEMPPEKSTLSDPEPVLSPDQRQYPAIDAINPYPHDRDHAQHQYLCMGCAWLLGEIKKRTYPRPGSYTPWPNPGHDPGFPHPAPKVRIPEQ